MEVVWRVEGEGREERKGGTRREGKGREERRKGRAEGLIMKAELSETVSES